LRGSLDLIVRLAPLTVLRPREQFVARALFIAYWTRSGVQSALPRNRGSEGPPLAQPPRHPASSRRSRVRFLLQKPEYHVIAICAGRTYLRLG